MREKLMKSFSKNTSSLACRAHRYLRYEIRDIVKIANQIELAGKKITWENIGDPIAKGHRPPQWLIEALTRQLQNPKVFGYGPSEGLMESREYLCKMTNARFQTSLQPEHIIFFNGLGDAISTFYRSIGADVRILLPSPVYPAHYALEGFHANDQPIQYPLMAENQWQPDFEFIRNALKKNPKIAGILLVNPDNPTGKVHSEDTLRKFVDIAREFKIFLMLDEIYADIQTDSARSSNATSYLKDVGAIIMRGISKLVPWPGGRCGWLEFHLGTHQGLNKIRETMIAHKQMEVGSSTLPQALIPIIFQPEHLEELKLKWSSFLKKRINTVMFHLSGIPGLTVHKPEGAFYLCAVFDSQLVGLNQTLPMETQFYHLIEDHLKNAPLDKRFTLQLLASTGICTIPLSSFYSSLSGFRMTLLEKSDLRFSRTCTELSQTIQRFLDRDSRKRTDGLKKLKAS